MITCKDLRRAIFVAVMFLVSGVFLLLVNNLFPGSQDNLLSLLVSYASFILILSSPVMLLVTAIRTMMPGAGKNLEHCIH